MNLTQTTNKKELIAAISAVPLTAPEPVHIEAVGAEGKVLCHYRFPCLGADAKNRRVILTNIRKTKESDWR